MALVDHEEFDARAPAIADLAANEQGLGRDLFRLFRANAAPAEMGAGVF
jgi:phosphogluconate dehydratase